MKFKRAIYIAAALLALLIVAPFLIPTGTYLRQIEQLASDKLGQPVAIGSLHVALLPTPRANIGNFRVGRNDEIRVEKITVIPDITTLFSPTKVISRIEVKQPVIKKAAFDMLGQLAGKGEATQGAAPAVIRHLAVQEARLEWEGMNIPEMDAEVELSDDGKPQSARLASVDGKLKLDAVPKEDGYAITLDARHLTPPAGPAQVFDSLKADMALQGSKLDVSGFTAKLYRGTVDGNAKRDWVKEWRASGKFKTA